jgi:large subunit ribosomal protein L25
MIMDFIKIDAWPRTGGKAATKELRREGRIPAVAYGHGTASRSLAISPKQLIAALQGPFGRNVVLQLTVEQEAAFPALLHDHAHHPVTRELEHVDFLHIDLSREVDVDVPLHCTGKAIGVVEGGVLNQVFRTLPLRCLPVDIPPHIEHDVTPLAQGDTVKTSQLALPTGIKVRLAPDQTVIAIVAPEAEKPEEVAPGAVAAVPGAEGAPGAVPAPGAEGAAPAAPVAAAAPAKAASGKKERGEKDRK